MGIVLQPYHLYYLYGLVAPLLFLPLLNLSFRRAAAWYADLLVVALPTLAEVLLGTDLISGANYSMSVVAIVFVAAISSMNRVPVLLRALFRSGARALGAQGRPPVPLGPGRTVAAAGFAVLFLILPMTWSFGAAPFSLYYRAELYTPGSEQIDAQEIAAQIPEGVALSVTSAKSSTTHTLLGHPSSRAELYDFPLGLYRAEMVVAYKPQLSATDWSIIYDLPASDRFRMDIENGTFILLARGPA